MPVHRLNCMIYISGTKAPKIFTAFNFTREDILSAWHEAETGQRTRRALECDDDDDDDQHFSPFLLVHGTEKSSIVTHRQQRQNNYHRNNYDQLGRVTRSCRPPDSTADRRLSNDPVQRSAVMASRADDCCGVCPPCSCCKPVTCCCPPCCPVPNCCPCPTPRPCALYPPCDPKPPECPGTCPTPVACPCKGCVYPDPPPPCPTPTPPVCPIPPCGCIPYIKPRPCCCMPPCCIPEPCAPPLPPAICVPTKSCDDAHDEGCRRHDDDFACLNADQAGLDALEFDVPTVGKTSHANKAEVCRQSVQAAIPTCKSPPPCKIPSCCMQPTCCDADFDFNFAPADFSAEKK
ncbi:unnamed protein product [Notodromas monacha]|uniref:Uncharacterized protein n=1 Tax=Notodromas monacha TaxID=399045 RepID=A0A7R9BF61_9CRUS|nr:unnamed protein product [Notodromas monacha]CAG0913071.1 unnamed protein product [Notodromas monacha]